MRIITHQDDLLTFCGEIGGGEYVTVDTEFIRDKTYFPRLCLLQMAGEGAEAIIDPLAGLDLAPVFSLLQKPGLLKVFHAARQDIEIFHLLTGHIPSPLFDTQIAASVCGFGESASYEMLAGALAGAQIDKGSRFTDWAARPLSDRQLTYALSDVTHLRDIYKALIARIGKSGREGWIEEEHARLADPALYRPDPADAWKRLKFGNMKPKNLAVLRELAGWREKEARLKDVPRGRILKDETLLELAATLPREEKELARLRGVDRAMPRAKIDAVLETIRAALALPPAEHPQARSRKRSDLPPAGALAMLQLLLKVQAEQEGIAASMIAGRDDLEAIALGDLDRPVMQGWRYELFGRKAQALLQGKIKLSLDPENGEVAFEEV